MWGALPVSEAPLVFCPRCPGPGEGPEQGARSAVAPGSSERAK